jgi:hypothetical protein
MRERREMRDKPDEQQKSKGEVKKTGFRHPRFYFNPARKKK